eukprot:gene10693-12478_t
MEMSFLSLLLAAFCCSTFAALKGSEWKDDWLRDWEAQALKSQPDNCPSLFVFPDKCPGILPKYLPARVASTYDQVIPKVIWQTWKSVQASGPNHYLAVLSFLHDNPEYEYYMFDDASALDFMCTFYPEHALLYQQVTPGAVKADLWRLAVMYRYGGVYFDTDCASTTSLKEIIWPNASVVTGLGVLRDFHQWALIYAPQHSIIKSTLKTAVRRLRQLYNDRKGGNIVDITGPGALSAGVNEALQAANCTPLARMQRSPRPDEIMDAQQSTQCLQSVGVLQIYSGDFLGNKVLFKHPNADKEKNSVSLYYGQVQNSHARLFHEVPIYSAGSGKVNVGDCVVLADAKYEALAKRHAAQVRKLHHREA